MGDSVKVKLATAGLSVFLLMTAFTFWGGIYSLMSLSLGTDSILVTYSIPLFIGFVASSLFVGWAFGKSDFRVAPVFSILSGLLIVGGMICMLVLGDASTGTMVLLIVSGSSFGVGSAAAFCSWEYVLSGLKRHDISRILLIGLVVFPVGYLLVIHAGIPSVVFGYVLVVLGCLSTFILFLLVVAGRDQNVKDLVTGPEANSFTGQMLGVFKRNRSMVFCFPCVAFIAAVTRCVALGDSTVNELVKSGSMIGVVVLALAVAVFMGRGKRKISYSRLYMVAFPVFATGLVLLPLMGEVYRVVFASVTFAFFLISSVFIMHQSIELSETAGVSAVVIFAGLNGMVYAAMGLGTMVGSYLFINGDFSVSTLAVVALALVYVIAIAATMIGRSKVKDDAPVEVVREKSDIDRLRGTEGEGQIERTCQRFSERFDFSARESEVVLLLAKGRDVPFIAETLFISKNTVRTHIKNIYRKTGAHTRQELLSAIEQVRG